MRVASEGLLAIGEAVERQWGRPEGDAIAAAARMSGRREFASGRSGGYPSVSQISRRAFRWRLDIRGKAVATVDQAIGRRDE